MSSRLDSHEVLSGDVTLNTFRRLPLTVVVGESSKNIG
jgi:hypothetical protein